MAFAKNLAGVMTFGNLQQANKHLQQDNRQYSTANRSGGCDGSYRQMVGGVGCGICQPFGRLPDKSNQKPSDNLMNKDKK